MIDVADQFFALRPLLFSIAYRMLGSVMDAEDAVQEAYLRWQDADRASVASPRAYLTTIVTRLCLDQLRSARVQREQYIGPWLPEPLPAGVGPDLEEHAALAESLHTAFLLLLERLSPPERAVFLLHDVFEYSFEEIAAMLGKSAAACRQIGKRARDHVAASRPRFTPAPDGDSRLVERFLRACGEGDLSGLQALLTEDIVLRSDGGGKVQAARNPIVGAPAAARLLLGILRKMPAGFRAVPTLVNGDLGLVCYGEGRVLGVLSLDVDGERIAGIYITVNPDKLRHLDAGDAGAAAH